MIAIGRYGLAPLLSADTASFFELRQQTRTLVAAADATGSVSTVPDWLEANRSGWMTITILTNSVVPGLFAWIGLLVGHRAQGIQPVEFRRLQYWAIGFCLIASTYLAGENSYEMIVLRAAGPVFFVAWLQLLPAALLLCGLGWSTAIDAWRSR